ncbi:MAG: hypothetical protein RRC07_16690 [Anaerolineae bacterium]|nr:hypothetical protein [Anaerolineae bacterium]
MKPLVLWCRWHEARLRLRGRDAQAVWGELAFANRIERFRYELESQRLTIGEDETARRVQLDDMGVEQG